MRTSTTAARDPGWATWKWWASSQWGRTGLASAQTYACPTTRPSKRWPSPMTRKVVALPPRGAPAQKEGGGPPPWPCRPLKTKTTHPSPKMVKRDVWAGSGSHGPRGVGPGFEASPTLVPWNRSWQGRGSPFSPQACARLLKPLLGLGATPVPRLPKGVRAPTTRCSDRFARAREATRCCHSGHLPSAPSEIPGHSALAPTIGQAVGGPWSTFILPGRPPGPLDKILPPGLQWATIATFCRQVRGHGPSGRVPGSRRLGAARPGLTVPHSLGASSRSQQGLGGVRIVRARRVVRSPAAAGRSLEPGLRS